MTAEVVTCYICKRQWALSLCVKVRSPVGIEPVCQECLNRLPERTQKQIRIT